MKKKQSIALLIIGIETFIITIFLPRIPQADSYHHFADTRSRFQISNFWNSFSNIPFVLIGLWGLYLSKEKNYSFSKLLYVILFVSIILTGIGSTIYHLDPSNQTLIFDRIPLVVLLTAYFLIVLNNIFDGAVWKATCIAFIIGGIASVLWWYYTETIGQGDLRYYAFFQFYPMICLAFLNLFPGQKAYSNFKIILLLYLIAKVCEYFDTQIFSWLPVSGHTIKHFVASIATFYMVKDFRDFDHKGNSQISNSVFS